MADDFHAMLLEARGGVQDDFEGMLSEAMTPEAGTTRQQLGKGVQQTSTTITGTTTTPHPIAEGIGAVTGSLIGGAAGAPSGLSLPGRVAGAGGGAVLARSIVEGRIPTRQEAAGAMVRGESGELFGQGFDAAAKGLGRATGLIKDVAPEAQAVSATAKRFGVPMMAGDVTLSRGTRMLENFPTYFAIGSGPVERFRGNQLAAFRGAAEGLTGAAEQDAADTLTAGLVSQGGVRAGVRAFRQQADQLFDQVETLAGPDPVVPTTRLRELAGSLLERARSEPFNAPGGTGKLLAKNVPTPQTSAIADAFGRPLTSATIKGQTKFGELADLEEMIQDAVSKEKIPFSQARRIESQLGQMAFGGKARPIGNIQQGQAGALYRAVRGDLDEYLTTPAAEDVAPALQEAKQAYATGKELFNTSMSKVVLGSRRAPVAPEKVIERVFRPGAVSDTLDFKLAVSDDVYETAVQAWKQGLYDKAVRNGQFSPMTFAREVAKYDKGGHLDVILHPEEAAAFRDLAGLGGRLGAAERLAGNPSGTGQAIESAAQFRHLLGPPGLGTLSYTGLPWMVGKAVTSQPGIDMLTQGLGGVLSPLIGGASRVGGQAAGQNLPSPAALLEALRNPPPAVP